MIVRICWIDLFIQYFNIGRISFQTNSFIELNSKDPPYVFCDALRSVFLGNISIWFIDSFISSFTSMIYVEILFDSKKVFDIIILIININIVNTTRICSSSDVSDVYNIWTSLSIRMFVSQNKKYSKRESTIEWDRSSFTGCLFIFASDLNRFSRANCHYLFNVFTHFSVISFWLSIYD